KPVSISYTILPHSRNPRSPGVLFSLRLAPRKKPLPLHKRSLRPPRHLQLLLDPLPVYEPRPVHPTLLHRVQPLRARLPRLEPCCDAQVQIASATKRFENWLERGAE